MNKAVYIYILFVFIVCLWSCYNKGGNTYRMKITIKKSVPDECDPFIKIDSNGCYYYKCSVLDKKIGSWRINISDEQDEINALLSKSFRDWESLSECNAKCETDSKNAFIVTINDGNISKSYTISGLGQCSSECHFIDDLSLLFDKSDDRLW